MSLSNISIFLVVVTLCCLSVLVRYPRDKRTNVRSRVNGKMYKVLPNGDPQQKADTLASIEMALFMVMRKVGCRKHMNLSESVYSTKDTAYTLNKKDIHLCMRYSDRNTLMYVALHEAAHVCSQDIGHTNKFWSLFSTMLHTAVKMGVYKYQNYQLHPEPYCGTMITGSPYTCHDC